LNRYVFKSRIKVRSDGADETECGRAFRVILGSLDHLSQPLNGISIGSPVMFAQLTRAPTHRPRCV